MKITEYWGPFPVTAKNPRTGTVVEFITSHRGRLISSKNGAFRRSEWNVYESTCWNRERFLVQETQCEEALWD